ncbi:MAG TPA: hypothetical protein PLA83_13490, partial [Deltaproteobacteria bacterium]|nr:hypothetical protein [Deltaproteobacteria bacterium]
KPIAKRGKDSGRKSVLRCRSCMRDYVVPYGQTHACECTGVPEPLLVKVIDSGKIVCKLPAPSEIRNRCLNELSLLKKDAPAREFLCL